MPPTQPIATALPDVERDPRSLRVVLFGMPDAGKSSLIGALVQSSHTQDRVLQGRLIDLTNGMAELWRRVYEERQRETLEEIVPYPIFYEPYAGAQEKVPNLGIMLYDCDGRVANELLSQRRSLKRDPKSGALARAILSADALILTIDASASDEQVETDFREFGRFLHVLESGRSSELAAGGLPVYVALTKCDKLAKEPIARSEWQKRIARRREQVAERFARYLQTHPGVHQPAFGSLNLEIHPTAVKHPALADAGALPRSPYGVANLFHDCIVSAYQFRESTHRANRKLRWVLGGSVAFLGAALLVALMLIFRGGPIERSPDLADRVERFEAGDKPLPDRLTGDVLRSRLNELTELRNHPDFGKLPEKDQNYVRNALAEVQAYLQFAEHLTKQPSPESARNLAELKRVREAIEQTAAIPAEYRSEWEKKPPPAITERQHRLEDVAAIEEGIAELKGFYDALRSRANDRLFAKDFDDRWESQANAVLSNEGNPPLSRGEGIKSAAYAFDEVVAAEKEWQLVRKRLTDVREMAVALGLTRTVPGLEAALQIPVTLPDKMNADAADRLSRLQKMYPGWKAWSLESMPEELQKILRRQLERSARGPLIRSGQQAVAARVRATGDDTAVEWKDAADWLLAPGLQEWRDLLAHVSKLLDEKAESPATLAAAFFRKDQFDFRIRSVIVAIPKDLPQGMLTPDGALRFVIKPRDGKREAVTLRFVPQQGAKDLGKEWGYRFVAEGDGGTATYKAGDEFSAQLPLVKGTKNWELRWDRPVTATFQFDALFRDPSLKATGALERASIADGVTVKVEGEFPHPPALLPELWR